MDLKTYCAEEKGRQARLAEKLKVSQGLVWQWLEWLEGRGRPNGKGTKITGERAREIEKATDYMVTVHDLRPDLFGSAPKKPSTEAAIEPA